MTLREYFDAQGFEFFKLIALYEAEGLIGHLPVAIWRRSKYKDREVLAVDDYAVLIREGSFKWQLLERFTTLGSLLIPLELRIQ